MSQQLQAERMRVERQTLRLRRWLVVTRSRKVYAARRRVVDGRLSPRATEREGVDVRLVLALGASEPCYGAEDDDEDDADEETPAVATVSIARKKVLIWRDVPVCHVGELWKVSEECTRRIFVMATSHVLAREASDLDVAPDGSGEHRRFLARA